MTQQPILTVTLNPAVDLAARVAEVVPGPKLRLSAPSHDPGGGGINVARAIRRLGGTAEAFVALAGPMGAQLAWMIRAEGVPLIAFDGPGETRHSLSVIAEDSGAEYRFVLPGVDWTGTETEAVLAAIVAAVPDRQHPSASGGTAAAAPRLLAGADTGQAAAPPQSAGPAAAAGNGASGRGTLVVLSGSQPPGVPDDFPARLARGLAAQGASLVVDTSGAALDRLIDLPDAELAPEVLRMDDAEAEATAGRALPAPADTADYAAALVARGVARVVVIARGADGSVLADGTRRLHCRPPRVEVASKVGAGDSFTGAFALALARGAGLEAALRAGTAAAAAAVTTPGTDLCHGADVDRLAPLCTMTTL